ncbi:MAG: branched-chain amino acid ABC transporter permease [Bradyrhizobiaceae bacterium]|nr:branched-chain amino acid ABC transporter permease [Bradyrhizobiaceae bacterium]
MNLALIAQSVGNALATGAIFGLMGLSFGLIYSTTRILHFAHGSVYVCAAYFFYAAYVAADWPLLPSAIAAVLGAGLLGFVVMRLFYEPMVRRGTSGAVVMIASLGLFIVIENLVVLVFGNDSRVISKGEVQQGLLIGNVYVTPLQLASFAVALATFAIVFLLVTRSKLGRGLRAIADNPAVGEIVGIDVRLLNYLVFALGSMVLAIAAVLMGLDIGVSPGMGLSVVLIATIAAIIGGANSMFAGIAGGFLVGAVQSMGVLWIDPRWQNLLIFSALIVVLVVRPTGVFGTAQR